MARPEACQAFEVPKFRTIQSCSLSSNWFSDCQHQFVVKPRIINEPAVPSAKACVRIVYPSNKQHIFK